MLQLNIPFQIELAVPFNTSSKIGTQHDNFQNLTKHRSSKIPVLIDDTFVLTESAAILTYLCERYGCDNDNDSDNHPTLYASPGTKKKAMIDSYMHWHHTHTRLVSKPFGRKIKPHLKIDLTTNDESFIQDVMTRIDTGWLSQSSEQQQQQQSSCGKSCYIGGFDTPSIADIIAYGELSTVTMTNLVPIDENKFRNLSSWMKQMSTLPYHDESHVALSTLGDLSSSTTIDDDDDDDISSSSTNIPIEKRLGAATKAGIASFEKAQK